MAVEDHARYHEWSKALDDLKEANDRYQEAEERKAANLEVYKLDLHRAQVTFDLISEEIG